MTNDVEALAAAIWTLHGRVKELQWPIVLEDLTLSEDFLDVMNIVRPCFPSFWLCGERTVEQKLIMMKVRRVLSCFCGNPT